MKNVFIKLLVGTAIGVAVFLFFKLGLSHSLTFESLKSNFGKIQQYSHEHPIQTVALYMAGYILMAALSLPGATLLTLMGGALFGFWFGLLLVSFASTIGATCAFLGSRFLMRDFVQKKFHQKLITINQKIKEEGAFYLFTLRLVPIFPFFVVNLVMGLTQLETWRFFVVSQVGMLPGTAVYVNAGTELGKLTGLGGILSPGLLLSFTLLGIFPILSKKLIPLFKRHRRKRK